MTKQTANTRLANIVSASSNGTAAQTQKGTVSTMATTNPLFESFNNYAVIEETENSLIFRHTNDNNAPVQTLDDLFTCKQAFSYFLSVRTGAYKEVLPDFWSKIDLHGKMPMIVNECAYGFSSFPAASYGMPAVPEGSFGIYSIWRGQWLLETKEEADVLHTWARDFKGDVKLNKEGQPYLDWNDRWVCTYFKAVVGNIFNTGYALELKFGPRTHAMWAADRDLFETADDEWAKTQAHDRYWASVQNRESFSREIKGNAQGVYQANADLSKLAWNVRVYNADHSAYEIRTICPTNVPAGARIIQYYKGTEVTCGSRNGKVWDPQSRYAEGYATEAMRRELSIVVPEGAMTPSALS